MSYIIYMYLRSPFYTLKLLHFYTITLPANEYEDDDVVLGVPSPSISFCCNEYDDSEDMTIILHPFYPDQACALSFKGFLPHQ